MKVTRHPRIIALVAVSALGLGGIVAAGPAVAGDDAPGAVRATAVMQDRRGPGGHGMGMGAGMGYGMGTGRGTPACPGFAVTADLGTLTDQQKHALAAMAQQEKLAHDLYGSFAGMYPVPVFRHIAAAESQHLSVVRTLLARYGLDDPTTGVATGKFSNPAVQATYDRFLARGTTTTAAALQVGQEVERTDIADLRKALGGLTAPDVTQAYRHLLTASQHHLAAFAAWANR
jgi:hypothetical protein